MLNTVEIEKMFHQEVREKKRTGSGSFHVRGKGKKHGTFVKLPYDLLSAKEKRKLNGKVEVFNMFQSLMSYADFQNYSIDQQKLILEGWRQTYKNSEIIEALGMNKDKFYALLNDLGVEKKQIAPRVSTKRIPTKEDLPNYNDLLRMSDEEKMWTLERLNKDFSIDAMAEIWNKTPAAVYAMKSAAKKRLERLERQAKKEEQLNLELKTQQEVAASIAVDPEPAPIESPQPIWTQTEKPTNEGLSGSYQVAMPDMQEVQQPIKRIVEQQDSLMLAYDKKSEGFMVHSDIKRLIGLLERNPDLFEVTLNIRRIEE